MKKLFPILLAVLLASSCKQNDTPAVVAEKEDLDWIKLEIPTGREAYAIAGDIDHTLLVTTLTKAYYTTDGGQTWQESKDFQGPVPGLLVQNDTIFSLKASGQDEAGNRYASLAEYFTADYGKTWKSCWSHYQSSAGYTFYSRLKKPIGIVNAPNGITYRIKENVTPVSPGATSFYINPSDIQKEDRFGAQLLRFPFKHHLHNLHIDSNNRLYVAASGGTHLEESNRIYCCTDETPAIVYVSRRPLP